MFGDVCCAGQPFPASFPALVQDSPLSRMAGRLFEDEMMDAVMEPHLVFGSRAWVRPRPHYCPYTCVVTRPRRPTRQHFVILPRLADDASGDGPCGRGKPADCCETRDKKETSSPSRRRTASTHSVSNEGCTSNREQVASPCRVNSESCTASRKQATSPCSVSSEGPEDCTSRMQATSPCSVSSQSPSDSARDCGGKTCRPTDISSAHEESPWQFSVDVKGCDEVRATTERGMLVVEGRGSSDTSQQMVRYITSLPRHVSHDSLTASLTNGRLTVIQKATAQLQGQTRTLPIDVQRQVSPEPEQQQWEQQQHQASPEPEQHQQSTSMAEQTD